MRATTRSFVLSPATFRRGLNPVKVACFSSAASERVKTRIESDGVCYVTLARPEKMNALDLPMFEAVAETAAHLRSDESLRAIIIHGEGKGTHEGAKG